MPPPPDLLLLRAGALDERRAAANGPLAPLAGSLARDLDPLIGRELYLPGQKALLSRAGGKCEDDGTALEFDPYSPDEHRCSRCGRTYRGALHHRWWIYSYQLWLAERGVHAALLHLLRGDPRHGNLARDIARAYADAYASYPNRDNVLGPSRLFFSTYIESIWLLQLCITASLLEAAGDRESADIVRTSIVVPASSLIAQYDEGLSNRQVWNNAALMASALLLGDTAGADRIVHAPSGVEAHLAHGLLADGSWYEGENYHLFAHRGLWYAVTMAEVAGLRLEGSLVSRFEEAFTTPFATALPDLTLPSRKDSQYAISLRQWRFAELCELGLARRDDTRLRASLAALYTADAPTGDTGRSRSTADVEHNTPPVRLARTDLGWRSLLHARPDAPPTAHAAARSSLLQGQGIAVFRRDSGAIYVALDYGQSGGGHGHPDRLNLMFSRGRTRWLDDLGTGSYVDRSLHWYRSTLAHNAPLVNGQSQQRVDGRLVAWDERGGVGWVLAEVAGIAPGVRASRALVVTPDYFVDELRWTAPPGSRFELPLHFGGQPVGLARESDAPLDGGSGAEDGFSFAHDTHSAPLAPMQPVELAAERDASTIRAFICADGPARWFSAVAPGQPASDARPFHVLRCAGERGVVRTVWAWSPRVTGASFDGERITIALGDERHVHYQTAEHWQVELSVAGAQSGIELTGWRPPTRPAPAQHAVDVDPPRPLVVRRSHPLVAELAEPHYRRSEQDWRDAGSPRARLVVTPADNALDVELEVMAGQPVFALRGAVNPYDNEHPDINGHGIQLYISTPHGSGAWMIVPEFGSAAARVRPIDGWGSLELGGTSWNARGDGYDLRARIPLPGLAGAASYPVALDVLVNEMPPGRERRRGQLVLSGGAGEFVYLRGDRHDPACLVPLLLEH